MSMSSRRRKGRTISFYRVLNCVESSWTHIVIGSPVDLHLQGWLPESIIKSFYEKMIVDFDFAKFEKHDENYEGKCWWFIRFQNCALLTKSSSSTWVWSKYSALSVADSAAVRELFRQPKLDLSDRADRVTEPSLHDDHTYHIYILYSVFTST